VGSKLTVFSCHIVLVKLDLCLPVAAAKPYLEGRRGERESATISVILAHLGQVYATFMGLFRAGHLRRMNDEMGITFDNLRSHGKKEHYYARFIGDVL
jgi:hypothetical protein